MKNRYHINRAQGFSVIEVLVSVLILGVGLAAMAQLHRSNIDGGLYAKQSSIAAELAQQKMADLEPKLSTATSGDDNPKDPGTNVKYVRSWTVAEATDGTTRVTVNVKWAGEETGITLSTVGKNYTPDQAFRTLKVVPVPVQLTNSAMFNSASSSSCTNYESESGESESCSYGDGEEEDDEEADDDD